MWKLKKYSKLKSKITFVKSYFEFTINSSILWILSNFAIKSIKIIIISNVIDRNIRIFILFFVKQCFFLSFCFCFDLSKKFQNNFNNAKTSKFVLNVIYQIINRMFIAFCFRFDFRSRKFEKHYSYFKFIFRNNSIYSKFRTSHFRFRFRFRFQSRF